MNADNSKNPPRTINLPGHRQRAIVSHLLQLHPYHSITIPPPTPPSPLKIVCISDTHNTQPNLPPGDVLIHAGDLTENGSFNEIQAQITWLSSQPHRYKVLIAGNHDVLLDANFLAKYPERRYGDSRTLDDLDWGSVCYLRDSSVTLEFEWESSSIALEGTVDGRRRRNPGDRQLSKRTLSIYGSPWTPQYGVSAFQHRREEDIWGGKIPPDTDIVVVHGPPRFHLDKRDFHRAGCPLLGAEIARVRPRLVVFGHIHVSYGREDVVIDRTRRLYEEVMNCWAGWPALVFMACCVLFARLKCVFGNKGMVGVGRVTTFVNAAVVGGPENKLQNEPIVVEL